MFRIRLPLLLAFLLAVLLSMVNVSAYKTAAVTSRATITVDTTSAAALALSSVSPMASISGGIMQINFQTGNGGTRSFQTAHTTGGVTVGQDRVQMRDAFRVTNNGSQCQNVSVFVSSGTVPNLTGIYGRLTGGGLPGVQLASSGGAQTANRVNLGAAGGGTNTMLVDVHWQADSVTPAGNFTVRVSSAYTATCP